ncbi:MAG: ABC transporter substrate-binding protein [Elusimicrobia bacterium]|nr:ABC transporter substrate-binding protein [Elusimicrobiota bacterium]
MGLLLAIALVWLPRAAQAAPRPLRIAMTDASKCRHLIALARESGYLREAGTEVEVVRVAARMGKPLEALILRKVDAMCATLDMSVLNRMKEAGIRAVADAGHVPAGGLDRTVLLVRKDLAGKVKGFADLKGMRLGGLHALSPRYIAFTRELRLAGLKPEDVRLIPRLGNLLAASMLVKGELDLAYIAEPEELLKQGVAEVFPPSERTRDFFHASLLFFSRDLREGRAADAKAFLTAYLKSAGRFSRMDAAGRLAALRRLDDRVTEREAATFLVDPEGRIDAGWLRSVQEHAVAAGWIEAGFQIEAVVDRRPVQQALAALGKQERDER